MVGSTVPLVTLQIADALSGNVLVGRRTSAGPGLDMIVIDGLVMASTPAAAADARWLA